MFEVTIGDMCLASILKYNKKLMVTLVRWVKVMNGQNAVNKYFM